jgi:hypothetical protein
LDGVFPLMPPRTPQDKINLRRRSQAPFSHCYKPWVTY